MVLLAFQSGVITCDAFVHMVEGIYTLSKGWAVRVLLCTLVFDFVYDCVYVSVCICVSKLCVYMC